MAKVIDMSLQGAKIQAPQVDALIPLEKVGELLSIKTPNRIKEFVLQYSILDTNKTYSQNQVIAAIQEWQKDIDKELKRDELDRDWQKGLDNKMLTAKDAERWTSATTYAAWRGFVDSSGLRLYPKALKAENSRLCLVSFLDLMQAIHNYKNLNS